MTKAERERLIEEKNRIIGQQKESQAKTISEKRKSFFESNSKGVEDEKMDDDANTLNDDDRALLKVHQNLQFNYEFIFTCLGKVFRNY